MKHAQIPNAVPVIPNPSVPGPWVPVPGSLLCIKFPAPVTRGPWRESNHRMLYSKLKVAPRGPVTAPAAPAPPQEAEAATRGPRFPPQGADSASRGPRYAVRRYLPPMTPRARRALFTLFLFFTVCAVAGTVLQKKVGAQSSEDESQIRDSLKSFTDVYSHGGAELRRADPGRKGRHRDLRRRHSGDAAGPRPALQFLRSQGVRQDARRPARPLLRRRHGNPAAEQQGLRHHSLRGDAVVPRRHPAGRHHHGGRRQERPMA